MKGKKKYMIPLILILAAFVTGAAANIILGINFNSYYDFSIFYYSPGAGIARVVIALILPVICMIMMKNNSIRKNAHGLLIAAVVIFGLQIVGNIVEILSGYMGLVGFRGFQYVPGTWIVPNIMLVINSIIEIADYGFETGGLAGVFCGLLYVISSVIYVLADIYVILMCSEFCSVPKLDGARRSIYNLFRLEEEDDDDSSNQYGVDNGPVYNRYEERTDKMENAVMTQYDQSGIASELRETKGIVVCILLSIVTCGIYGLIWQYSIIKKIKLLNNDTSGCAGEFVCCILVPFYAFYWYYTRAGKLSDGAARYGIRISNNGVLYLILAIFALSIVNICLMQNDLNTIAKTFAGETVTANMGTQTTREFNEAYNDVTGAAENITKTAAPKAAPQEAPSAEAAPQEAAAPETAAPQETAPAEAVTQEAVPTEAVTKEVMPKAAAATDDDVISKIKKLAEIHDSGIITDEEFKIKKDELLKRI